MLALLVLNDRTGSNESANYSYRVQVNTEVIAKGEFKGHNRNNGWTRLVCDIAEQEEQMSWCATTKRLPTRDGLYLTYLLTKDGENVMLTATFEKENGWNVPNEWKDAVSHWRQLPSPPKMETLVTHK